MQDHSQVAPPNSPLSPAAQYERRCATFAAQRDAFQRRSRRMANVNLALFGAAIVCIGIAIWQRNALFLVVALLLFVSFVASYAYHTWIDRRVRHFDLLWSINNEGVWRMGRAWQHLPLRQPTQPTNDPVAVDLDLLGRASLQHLLSTTTSPAGQITLQRWLLDPAAPALVEQRQAAVAELAHLIDLRDQLALHGRQIGTDEANYLRFGEWAEGDQWLLHRPWLVWLSRILPVLTIGGLLAQTVGVLSVPIWIVGVVAQVAVLRVAGGRAEAVIENVSARQSIFRAYGDLFGVVVAQRFEAPLLQQMQAELRVGPLRADQLMRRLGRIMAFADFRFFMFFTLVNILTLWNIHVLWALERWQQDAGNHTRSWLRVLGELEALAALATLRHDNPRWTFPRIESRAEPHVRARGVGHPLLPPAACVPNDVEIGPLGTFLLVTGSNMSGKSTLLRAIGLNVALAQAGGPVCATAMTLTPLVLATSMRVSDSLEQGVSYFMAELMRLKAIVDQAQVVQTAGERTLLFLLDEILHGTNTHERQIAARQIIVHLVAQGAIGAVSTHDLTLADAPDIAAISQRVYFTEDFTRGPDGPTMHFDYTLRPGLAVSTNALKLMEILGLPLDEPIKQES